MFLVQTVNNVIPREQVANIGDVVHFNCVSITHATWKFEEGLLPLNAEPQQSSGTNILTISNVNLNNTGRYTCIGSSSFYSMEKSKYVTYSFTNDVILIVIKGNLI